MDTSDKDSNWTIKPQRMWINQPSTLQPLHKLHGKNVLAIRESQGWYTIYFLDGDVISQIAPLNTLSNGWLNK